MGGSGGPVLDFSVAIYPSTANGTQPDVVNPPLVQYSTGGNAGETVFGTVGGITMYSYKFVLPAAFQAAAATKYWVQIEATQNGDPDWGLAAGTGGDGWYFRRYHCGVADCYQFVPYDTAFTLLGSLNLPFSLYLPAVLK